MLKIKMLFAGALTIAACFEPRYPRGLPCNAPADCPPEQVCVDSVCRECGQDEPCDQIECVDGNIEPCGVGQCPRDGTRECVSGRWSECSGATLPAPMEICNDLRDNDCDGTIDDDCDCQIAESPKACGACNDGTQICDAVSGKWGPCLMATTPSPCCPGQTRSCGTDTGECHQGTETCTQSGRWSGICNNSQGPVPETCNGRDDNCDGLVDNDPSRACQKCVPIPTVLVDRMAPQYAGDAEFAGHGPQVWITTQYRHIGVQVCADVSVRMLETAGSPPSEARKTVTQCGTAAGLVASVLTPTSTHTYIDSDHDNDLLSIQPGTGIGQIECTGDTGHEDICNDQPMPGCSGCQVSGICVKVTYH